MIFLCLLYVKMDIDDKEVSEIISKEYNSYIPVFWNQQKRI